MLQPVTPPPANQPPRWPSVVGPAILIIVGLTFLAQNLGLFEYNIWALLWRLWPVWLIAVGLDLVLGRRTAWGSWLVLGLIVTIIGGALWFGSSFGTLVVGTEPVSISQPVGDARQADVRIDSSVAKLFISAGNQDTLVEGTVVPLKNERLEKSAYSVGGTLVFTLKSKSQTVFGFSNVNIKAPTWDLRLSDQIPLNLLIDAGVGESRLDLSRIQLRGLEVDAGVGDTEITLPANGKFRVDIDAGVGEVTLRIPKELAARIHVDQGVGQVRVRGDFAQSGKTYLSPDFGRSENQVEIEIDGGVGEITVEQI